MFRKVSHKYGQHKGGTKWYELLLLSCYNPRTGEDDAILIRRYDAVGSVGRIMIERGSLKALQKQLGTLIKGKADYGLVECDNIPKSDLSIDDVLDYYSLCQVGYLKVLREGLQKVAGIVERDEEVNAKKAIWPTPKEANMPEGWGAWG